LAVVGSALAFVTVHPEGLPTAAYRLDPEKLTLTEEPLPAGGQSLLATTEGLWIGGTDGQLYHQRAKGGKVTPLGKPLAAPAAALAPLSNERLAAASGAQVVVLARGDGKVLQTLEMPEQVTCLAADPTGQWLAAGTVKGTISVFECETEPAFRPSDSAALHEAAVTAILFEADELRFLSAGADQKLLSTHARGRLEAEDRGRGANHTEPITAMVPGPADRFLTGSSDASIKSWPRAKGARPVTLKDGVGKVVALAVVSVHGKPQVVAACQDNTLRFFHLDEEGKFGEAAAKVHGIEGWAVHELGQADPARREQALRTLAGFADAASGQRIATQMTSDSDHALRLLACRLLAEMAHPQAGKVLEKALSFRDEAVRVAAFEGLRRHAGPKDLRPLVLALKAGKPDVGCRAVEALEGLAGQDEQALARLVEALEEKVPEVRRQALASLEKVQGADSPQPSLTALAGPHADLRRLALVRLYQRKLLHDPRVQAALRWRGEDPDPEVRRVAFLLSLYTREKLLQALRQRDAELDRQLTELESGTLPAMTSSPPATAKVAAPKVAAPAAPGAAGGDEELMGRVQTLVQQGMLPPQYPQLLQRMLQTGGPQLEAIRRAIMARFGQLSEEAPAAPAAPGPAGGDDELMRRVQILVQRGMLPPQYPQLVQQWLKMGGPQLDAIRRAVMSQFGQLFEETPAAPPSFQPGVAAPAAGVPALDTEDLARRVEELVQRGMLPPQFRQHIQRMLQAGGSQLAAFASVILSRFGQIRFGQSLERGPQTEDETEDE
jgi:ParB family chromosome partitioning protein